MRQTYTAMFDGVATQMRFFCDFCILRCNGVDGAAAEMALARNLPQTLMEAGCIQRSCRCQPRKQYEERSDG